MEQSRIDRINELARKSKTVGLTEEEKAEELDLGINIGNDNGYLNEIQYFVDCVNKGVSPDFITPESSANTMKLVDKIKATAIKL